MYYLRSPEERAVLDFFRAHRDAKFNVALHVRKCEGDDRDFDLMRGLMERASYECWIRIGPENCLVPAVHVMIRKRPLLWPEDVLGADRQPV